MVAGQKVQIVSKDVALTKQGKLKAGYVMRPTKAGNPRYYKKMGGTKAAPAKKAASRMSQPLPVPFAVVAPPAAPAKKARAKRGKAKPPAAAYWLVTPQRKKALSQTKRNKARRAAYANAVLPAKQRACKKIGMVMKPATMGAVIV